MYAMYHEIRNIVIFRKNTDSDYFKIMQSILTVNLRISADIWLTDKATNPNIIISQSLLLEKHFTESLIHVWNTLCTQTSNDGATLPMKLSLW